MKKQPQVRERTREKMFDAFLRNIKKTLSEGLLWELFQEERM